MVSFWLKLSSLIYRFRIGTCRYEFELCLELVEESKRLVRVCLIGYRAHELIVVFHQGAEYVLILMK